MRSRCTLLATMLLRWVVHTATSQLPTALRVFVNGPKKMPFPYGWHYHRHREDSFWSKPTFRDLRFPHVWCLPGNLPRKIQDAAQETMVPSSWRVAMRRSTRLPWRQIQLRSGSSWSAAVPETCVIATVRSCWEQALILTRNARSKAGSSASACRQ